MRSATRRSTSAAPSNFRIRQVAEVVPACKLSFALGASPDVRNDQVDFIEAERSLPRDEPTWTLRAGIEELYDAYKPAA